MFFYVHSFKRWDSSDSPRKHRWRKAENHHELSLHIGIHLWCGVVWQERMEEARDLFRNQETTEFVIVTIPTVMAVSESGRLAKALVREGVPVHALAINQVHLADAHPLCA